MEHAKILILKTTFVNNYSAKSRTFHTPLHQGHTAFIAAFSYEFYVV